jgi:hypothetical protein
LGGCCPDIGVSGSRDNLNPCRINAGSTSQGHGSLIIKWRTSTPFCTSSGTDTSVDADASVVGADMTSFIVLLLPT